MDAQLVDSGGSLILGSHLGIKGKKGVSGFLKWMSQVQTKTHICEWVS